MNNFTNSKLATIRQLHPRNRNAPRSQPITKITPHHVAGVMTSKQLLNFGHSASNNASWNYGIGNDGAIHQLVNESDRAWTSSSAWNDHRTVTIEVSNSTREPNWEIGSHAWNAMIGLMVDVIRRNPGITRRDGRTPGLWFDGTQNASLTFHNMFAATACPGPFIVARAQQICNEVNARLDELNSPASSSPPTPVSPIHVVRSGENLTKIANHHNTTVDELVRLNNVADRNVIRTGQIIQLPVSTNTNTQGPAHPSLTVDQLARQVIAGQWGNGDDRIRRLRNAGHDPQAVQQRVNQLLR